MAHAAFWGIVSLVIAPLGFNAIVTVILVAQVDWIGVTIVLVKHNVQVVSEVFSTLKQLGEKGITILLSEQNAHLAFSIAQRGYILSEGRITKIGNTIDLAKDLSVQQAYLGI